MSSSACMIMCTTGDEGDAELLAAMLIERRLAACVQMIQIDSTYIWEGDLVQEPEYLLLIKTDAALYPEVEAAIVENHSYEVPEILQVPIVGGLESYLAWMRERTER